MAWLKVLAPRTSRKGAAPDPQKGYSLGCRAARLLSTFPSEATKPEVPRQFPRRKTFAADPPGFAKPVYLCARAAQIGTVASLCSVPPGRAQREPQGYAGLTRVAERAQTWGATFEFHLQFAGLRGSYLRLTTKPGDPRQFTMLTRRRFAPPRSQSFTGAFRARIIMKSVQLTYPRHPQDHPPLLFRILV